MEFTGEICEVNPFISTYTPLQEIPVAHCGTVWTCDTTGRDFLLVGDEMLWFGTQSENSLINPNQIRASGLQLNDNPFTHSSNFGIKGLNDSVFIPFDTTGTIIHFPSRVPNGWELVHLPVLPLFPDRWDPNETFKPTKRNVDSRSQRDADD
jgi:hypothetical protein